MQMTEIHMNPLYGSHSKFRDEQSSEQVVSAFRTDQKRMATNPLYDVATNVTAKKQSENPIYNL